MNLNIILFLGISFFSTTSLATPNSFLSQANTLAEVMYCEASVDGSTAMLAVADVVLNRVKSQRFPDTIQDVVYQKHQFECITRGRQHKIDKTHDSTWKKAFSLAIKKLRGETPRMTYATLYHANWMTKYPKWSSSPKISFVGSIGQHRFYSYR